MTKRQFSSVQRGFTLIELLVVVAIIGILATLVLVSLGTVRSRARDARINADIASISTQCEILADVAGNYAGCPGNAQVATLLADIGVQNGGGADPTEANVVLANDSGRFCVFAELNTAVAGAHNRVCRDSDGNVTLPAGTAGAACPNTAVCTP